MANSSVSISTSQNLTPKDQKVSPKKPLPKKMNPNHRYPNVEDPPVVRTKPPTITTILTLALIRLWTNRNPLPQYESKTKHWINIQNYHVSKEIQYRRAVNTSDSFKINLNSVANFRTLTRKLEFDNTPCTTHQLRQDKDPNVFIRGVNKYLLSKKFPTNSVHNVLIFFIVLNLHICV